MRFLYMKAMVCEAETEGTGGKDIKCKGEGHDS